MHTPAELANACKQQLLAGVKERPIIFSAPMVRALLAGTKTQTRRVVKPQPTSIDEHGRWYRMPGGGSSLNCYGYPYGVAGDRLWVRETWHWAPSTDTSDRSWRGGDPRNWFYRATDEDDLRGIKIKWKPAIHMPRAASRLTLEIVSVRVERLQEISEADAKAEGIHKFHGLEIYGHDPNGTPGPMCMDTARFAFGALWDSLNAKRAPWASNPWIWVIEFRRLPT